LESVQLLELQNTGVGGRIERFRLLPGEGKSMERWAGIRLQPKTVRVSRADAPFVHRRARNRQGRVRFRGFVR